MITAEQARQLTLDNIPHKSKLEKEIERIDHEIFEAATAVQFLIYTWVDPEEYISIKNILNVRGFTVDHRAFDIPTGRTGIRISWEKE